MKRRDHVRPKGDEMSETGLEPRVFLAWCYEVVPGQTALLTKAEVERRGLPYAEAALRLLCTCTGFDPHDRPQHNRSCPVYAPAEKWGVWNVTFDGWAMPGLDSWHVTREAAKRECDAWSKATGCTYEPREKGPKENRTMARGV